MILCPKGGFYSQFPALPSRLQSRGSSGLSWGLSPSHIGHWHTRMTSGGFESILTGKLFQNVTTKSDLRNPEISESCPVQVYLGCRVFMINNTVYKLFLDFLLTVPKKACFNRPRLSLTLSILNLE